MKKIYWTRLILFFAMLTGFGFLFNFAPKHERTFSSDYWRYFYKDLPKSSMDVVFLGNSHSQCTFIPEIIDSILDIHTINLYTPSENIHLAKSQYQEVLANQNPQAVIIEASSIFIGNDEIEKRPAQYSFYDSMPLSLKKVQTLFADLTIKELANYYFPFIAMHTDWKTPAKQFKEFANAAASKNTPVTLENMGYTQRKDPLQEEELKKVDFDEFNTCPNPDLGSRLKTTEQVFKIDQGHPSQLVFIEAPTLTDKYRACVSSTDELFQTYGKPYHRLFEDVKPAMLLYNDPDHLSQFGAIIASIETARILSDELGYAIDPQVLAYYESYQFKDYTLVEDGNRLEFSLIPFDQAQLESLDFTWEVLVKGSPIHKETRRGGTIFVYEFKELPEKYMLRVTINNPAGDYELVGEFTFIEN